MTEMRFTALAMLPTAILNAPPATSSCAIDRPVALVPPDVVDPIGAMIDMAAPDYPTGGIKTPAAAR